MIQAANPRADTNDERDLVQAAQAGDRAAFDALAHPLRRELHVHCYRMLGTLHDADDALQETLLRAWRQLARFEPRAPFRAWLYRIATNVCLTALERRRRRSEIPLDRGEDAAMSMEPARLQPYPGDIPAISTAPGGNPELAVEAAERVGLAFVASVQLLPPRQRATLLLREVLGYSAAEVAQMLETSVASVNSALQRARATLAAERATATVARRHVSPGKDAESALVTRLIDAWQAADVPAIVAILTEDALFSMPPLPEHYVGREAIAAFLASGPAQGRLDRFRLLTVRANGQPALAAYWRHRDEGLFHAHGILVVALAGEAIASITRFGEPDLFARFGLPLSVPE